jgi:AcrR family transcriptional regulator
VTKTVPMRDRILAAATELFYAEGFRAVSAEKIVARVGVTKVTFYRHFPSKDDLMVAYLDELATLERELVGDVLRVAESDPDAALRQAVNAIVVANCRPGYRGCPFINAAAEYADPAHPVRLVVARHRAWLTAAFARLAASLGVTDAATQASAACDLMVLRDGAAVGSYLGDADAVSRALLRSAGAVLAAYRADPARA